MTVEAKETVVVSAYESGLAFYDRKISEAVDRLTNTDQEYDRITALEEMEEASLKRRHLERRHTKGLI